MHFSIFVIASILATSSFALSDNCTANDVSNCFLSDPMATPFCISYLQIALVTETVIPPTLIMPAPPTSIPEVSLKTIDPAAIFTNGTPAIPTNLGELPDDTTNNSDTASPTDNPVVLGARDETTTSNMLSPTLIDFVIGPIESQDNAPMSLAPAPTPTCLSQEDQTMLALISSACSCLAIAPGTTTVILTAPIPTWTGLPGGVNGTDGGNGTSIIDPSGQLNRTTRRHPRPSRGSQRLSTV